VATNDLVFVSASGFPSGLFSPVSRLLACMMEGPMRHFTGRVRAA